MTSERRIAARIAWICFACIAALFVFAIIGGSARTPTFEAIPVEVPVSAMALLTFTFTAFALVGALIVSGATRTGIGWLFLAIGASCGATLAAIVYEELGLPGSRWAAWSSEWTSTGVLTLMPFVLLLFPDGRLPHRRWRPVAWIALLNATMMIGSGIVSPYVGEQYVYVEAMVGWYVLPVTFVFAAACFVMRFRRASGVLRRQLLWFSAAATIAAVGFLFQEATWFAWAVLGWRVVGLGLVVLIVSLATVPVASGIAILRHRLYDIDVIINRALVYGALTAVLGVAYAMAAVGFGIVTQQMLETNSNNLAVAGSTLAVATLFRPARTWVQNLIDRRFYRARFDASATVASFSAQVQHDVDLEALTAHLAEAVSQTLQPTTTVMWLRAPGT